MPKIGYQPSQETKEKISRSLKQYFTIHKKICSDETKKKMSLVKKGISFSLEHRQNISKAKIGRKIPKISLSKRGKNNFWYGKNRPEHSKRMKGTNNPMFGKKRPDLIKRNKLRNGKNLLYMVNLQLTVKEIITKIFG